MFVRMIEHTQHFQTFPLFMKNIAKTPCSFILKAFSKHQLHVRYTQCDKLAQKAS